MNGTTQRVAYFYLLDNIGFREKHIFLRNYMPWSLGQDCSNYDSCVSESTAQAVTCLYIEIYMYRKLFKKSTRKPHVPESTYCYLEYINQDYFE